MNKLGMKTSSGKFEKKDSYIYEYSSQPNLNKTLADMHVESNIINFEENVTPKNISNIEKDREMTKTTNSHWPKLSNTKFNTDFKHTNSKSKTAHKEKKIRKQITKRKSCDKIIQPLKSSVNVATGTGSRTTKQLSSKPGLLPPINKTNSNNKIASGKARNIKT